MARNPCLLRILRGATSPTFSHSESYAEYARAYWEASKSLHESFWKHSNKAPTPDFVVLPVLYLLHHWLELELKQVVRLSYSLGSIERKEVQDFPAT